MSITEEAADETNSYIPMNIEVKTSHENVLRLYDGPSQQSNLNVSQTFDNRGDKNISDAQEDDLNDFNPA